MAESSTLMVSVGAEQDEKPLENLEAALKEMPINMLVLSATMRSLFVEKAVDTNESAARKFRELRDDTRNDAMVYLQHILPMSHKLVTSIQGFFEYYIYLNYDQWIECLPDILRDVQGYRQLCEAAVKMHQSIMVPLKERADQAKLVMAELTDLQQQYERRKKELEASAKIKTNWFWGLAFIPVVNIVACPLLESSVNMVVANAVAQGAQANCQAAAACAVANDLMPALNDFIKGLQTAAGFFKVMENELSMFAANKGEKVQNEQAKHHYIMMNKKSKAIISSCQMFGFALPSVRTDFEAIPTEGTDQNYIDIWLCKQYKIIEEACTIESIYNGIISGLAGTHKPKKALPCK